ncbi:MAG: DNA (cytosine-5-)-methyltransferase [Candidatus Methanomethylicaceae archaeon]
MVARKYKLISLFSGAGGMDLGFKGDFEFLGRRYERLPFEIAFAIDVDPRAVDTYNSNLDPVCVLGDATAMDFERLPKADVVIGGFPCQDFSVAGKRKGLRAERGRLYLAMVKVVDRVQPAIFVAENVSGLISANDGEALEIIKSDFARAGIGYRVFSKVLDAADYGVPQRRRRLFIVGVRSDIDRDFEFPTPTHAEPILADAMGLQRWVTAREALKDLEDEKVLMSLPNHERSKAKLTRGQGNKPIRPDAPSTTIRAEHHGNIEFHYSLPRRLSVRECARLQSFPDDFVFKAPMSSAYKLVGNAVPPVLAWHVAKAVAGFLEGAFAKEGVTN